MSAKRQVKGAKQKSGDDSHRTPRARRERAGSGAGARARNGGTAATTRNGAGPKSIPPRAWGDVAPAESSARAARPREAFRLHSENATVPTDPDILPETPPRR